MARKLRMEYEGALYHVTNRGNDRSAVFETQGARNTFLKCLGEACVKSKWVVHGYVLMSNHYHLALETPEGNLVEGMKWLQSTFAHRYNLLRGKNARVFQGRYKALLIEDQARLGALCHFIHLNPVRARILPVERLGEYLACSYWMLQNPKNRPSWLKVQTGLEVAGDWSDTALGRREYAQYLQGLAEDEPAQKALNFDAMAKGGVLGSLAFKQALAKDHKKLLASGPTEKATRKARELSWHAALKKALRAAGKSPSDIRKERKAVPWKVAIAAHFRTTSQATNVWLAEHLAMGAPAGVSRYVSQFLGQKKKKIEQWNKISKITV